MSAAAIMYWALVCAGAQVADASPPPQDITVTAPSAGDQGGGASLDAGALRDLDVRSLVDLAQRIPNLSMTRDGAMGIGQLAIRGIRSPVGAASVLVYLDDVPVQIRPSAFAATSDLQVIDLARIDVARGPEGTRGGMSALAGAIRFTSRAPDPTMSDATAYADARGTRFGSGSYRIAAVAGGPVLGNVLALRGGIVVGRSGGYVDRLDPVSGTSIARDVDTVRNQAARLALTARLGNGWSVTPSLHVQRSVIDDVPLTENDRGRLAQAFATRQPGSDRLAIGSLSIVHVGASARFSATTAFVDRRQRQATDYSRVFGELVLGGAIPGILTPGGSSSLIALRQRNWTQEIRLAAIDDDRSLDWVVGLFASHAELWIDQSVVEPGVADLALKATGAGIVELFGVPLLPGGISYAAIERDIETRLAGYADATWRMTPDLHLGAGIRVSRAAVTIRAAAAGPYAGRGDFVSEGGHRVDQILTPRASLSWMPGERQSLRIGATRGYRPGGANTLVPAALCESDLAALGRTRAPRDYSSDTLWNYELTYRYSARLLTLEQTLFLANWNGIAQQIDLPRCGFSFIANAGRARSRGFETAVVFSPIAALHLSAALGYTDARFRTTIPAPDGAALVRRGDRLPYVPRWSGTIGMETSLPSRGGRWRARADMAFGSRFVRAPSRDVIGYAAETYRGAATYRLDLLAAHHWQRWSATVFCENATDARPALLRSIDLVPATRSPLRETTMRPRTIGLRAEVSL